MVPYHQVWYVPQICLPGSTTNYVYGTEWKPTRYRVTLVCRTTYTLARSINSSSSATSTVVVVAAGVLHTNNDGLEQLPETYMNNLAV